ncbi:MAG: hypothetical protein M0037_07415 [Betaproteobacteria bacterium]|nr:hypothetical protein [Betaproteobacteria bacterium]
MEAEDVRRALALDRAWVERLHAGWLSLMDLAVFGDLRSSRLGAMGRIRKRVLDVGEKLRALTGSREWLTRPRERLKHALASSYTLKESLSQLDRAAGEADGGAALAVFRQRLGALQDDIAGPLAGLEQAWAALLDAQYFEEDEPD